MLREATNHFHPCTTAHESGTYKPCFLYRRKRHQNRPAKLHYQEWCYAPHGGFVVKYLKGSPPIECMSCGKRPVFSHTLLVFSLRISELASSWSWFWHSRVSPPFCVNYTQLKVECQQLFVWIWCWFYSTLCYNIKKSRKEVHYGNRRNY